MSHEENMERVKALTEDPQSSAAAPPEAVRPLENEEPGATKEAKVADRLEGSLIAARLGSSQTSKTAAGDLKTPEEKGSVGQKKDEAGQYGVGSVEKMYLLIRIQGCLIIRKWQLPRLLCLMNIN